MYKWLMRKLGWVPANDYAAMRREIAELRTQRLERTAEIAQLEVQLAEARASIAAMGVTQQQADRMLQQALKGECQHEWIKVGIDMAGAPSRTGRFCHKCKRAEG